MEKIMPPWLLVAVLSSISLRVQSEGMIYKCNNPQVGTVYKKSPCIEEGQTVSKWEEPVREQKTISIRQGNSGHYFLEGEVNSTTFTFVVDTGASGVALPSSIAVAAKIDCKVHVAANTANGITDGCYVTLPVLRFGPFQLENIKAMILPNLEQPLLGMDVLERFNIEQDHGEMRISER